MKPWLEDWDDYKQLVKNEQGPVPVQLYIDILAVEGQWDDAWNRVKKMDRLDRTVIGCLLHELEDAEQWVRLIGVAQYALEIEGEDWEHYPQELAAFQKTVSFGKCSALLMVLSGQLQELLARCSVNAKCVGWTEDRAEPVAVACSLIFLCREQDVLPATVEQFALRYLSGYEPCPEFIGELKRVVASSALGASNDPDSLIWDSTRDLLIKRAEYIVSNTYRGAYDRAAEGIAAWAECARLHGRHEQASGIVTEILGKFPRHSAFKREMRARM